MGDIPEFELGFITDGAGEEIHDEAVAFSVRGDERALRLEGEDASGIMPRIVASLNAHDDMLTALHEARLQIEYLHDKFKATGTGETTLVKIRAAIAKATA